MASAFFSDRQIGEMKKRETLSDGHGWIEEGGNGKVEKKVLLIDFFPQFD